MVVTVMNSFQRKYNSLSFTFLISHFEISGNDYNELHPENIPFIFIILLVSHFEISDNELNGTTSIKHTHHIHYTYSIHFEISDND